MFWTSLRNLGPFRDQVPLDVEGLGHSTKFVDLVNGQGHGLVVEFLGLGPAREAVQPREDALEADPVVVVYHDVDCAPVVILDHVVLWNVNLVDIVEQVAGRLGVLGNGRVQVQDTNDRQGFL